MIAVDQEVRSETRPPIGVRYCLSHSGLREEDESRGCDMRDDASVDDCQFVELFPGTQVVETYTDTWGE